MSPHMATTSSGLQNRRAGESSQAGSIPVRLRYQGLWLRLDEIPRRAAGPTGLSGLVRKFANVWRPCACGALLDSSTPSARHHHISARTGAGGWAEHLERLMREGRRRSFHRHAPDEDPLGVAIDRPLAL